ncbi:hypothetical protein ACHAWF_011444 [Thalassiosira exigua]
MSVNTMTASQYRAMKEERRRQRRKVPSSCSAVSSQGSQGRPSGEGRRSAARSSDARSARSLDALDEILEEVRRAPSEPTGGDARSLDALDEIAEEAWRRAPGEVNGRGGGEKEESEEGSRSACQESARSAPVTLDELLVEERNRRRKERRTSKTEVDVSSGGGEGVEKGSALSYGRRNSGRTDQGPFAVERRRSSTVVGHSRQMRDVAKTATDRLGKGGGRKRPPSPTLVSVAGHGGATPHSTSSLQVDELLMAWPEGGEGEKVRFPETVLSERAQGMSASRKSAVSLPDVLDELEELEEKKDAKPSSKERWRAERRNSSLCSHDAIGMNLDDFYRPRRKNDPDKAPPSGGATGDGDGARSGKGSLSSPTKKKKKKDPTRRVSFSASEPSLRYYDRPSDDETAALFYNRDDDNAFSDLAVDHARAVRSYLRTCAAGDASFNKLTGLPSPDALSRHLLSPEDIVGVEHLLCGRGIAKASVSLKVNHVKALLGGQRKGDGPEELAERLRKYSDISAKLAVCRASYAAMF